MFWWRGPGLCPSRVMKQLSTPVGDDQRKCGRANVERRRRGPSQEMHNLRALIRRWWEEVQACRGRESWRAPTSGNAPTGRGWRRRSIAAWTLPMYRGVAGIVSPEMNHLGLLVGDYKRPRRRAEARPIPVNIPTRCARKKRS